MQTTIRSGAGSVHSELGESLDPSSNEESLLQVVVCLDRDGRSEATTGSIGDMSSYSLSAWPYIALISVVRPVCVRKCQYLPDQNFFSPCRTLVVGRLGLRAIFALVESDT